MAGRFVLPDGDFERVDMRVFFPARPVQHEESGLTHYVLVIPGEGGERELSRYSMDHTSLREA